MDAVKKPKTLLIPMESIRMVHVRFKHPNGGLRTENVLLENIEGFGR
jgi:hypothetical protein